MNILVQSTQAPEIVSLYSLSVSPQYVRQQLRQRFEENRYVTDLRVVNQLYLKSRQEYQETMNFWKQKEHVMGKLLLPRGRPQRTFLQKFYEGTSLVHPLALAWLAYDPFMGHRTG